MNNSSSLTLIFMLEEKSAESLLEQLLPEILPGVECLCIAHNGRGDLQKSIPIKLKAWNKPNNVFIILHDQDSHDCKELKHDLQVLCNSTGRSLMICIVCRELEAWYFGDLDAVEQAYPKFNAIRHKNRAQFRNPDSIDRPSKVLMQMIKPPVHSKVSLAKAISPHMDIENNASASFKYMRDGIRNLVNR